MLEFLRGNVARVTADAAVLEIGGVGVRVLMPTGDLSGLDGEVTVLTDLVVREDDITIFGFVSEHSRQLFRMLTKVDRVGPKLALAVLSVHAPAALERAIVAGDHGSLTVVPGVGKKTAQRIVLELKDKLGALGDDTATAAGPLSEVREALLGLGYSAQEAQDAIAELPVDGDAPTLLRHALRALGGREGNGVPR